MIKKIILDQKKKKQNENQQSDCIFLSFPSLAVLLWQPETSLHTIKHNTNIWYLKRTATCSKHFNLVHSCFFSRQVWLQKNVAGWLSFISICQDQSHLHFSVNQQNIKQSMHYLIYMSAYNKDGSLWRMDRDRTEPEI